MVGLRARRGGSIRTWKYQIEAFQPHYRLLLIDLRDHGFSKDILPEFPEYDFDIVSEDILAVVDHLGIERAHFVSLSIGSVILQKIDIERPELIDRMVMAGAIFDGSRLMHWFVHSGKLLNYILPYRAIYWLFSFIVLPVATIASAVGFSPPELASARGLLNWVELYKPFFGRSSSMLADGGQARPRGDGVSGPHFLQRRREVCPSPKEHAPRRD